MSPVEVEPLVARVPDQAPEPAHVVALLAFQVRTALEPMAMTVGVASIVTTGFVAPLSPSIVTMAEVELPRTTFSACAIATARVLVPVNGFMLLIGMLKLLGVASPFFQPNMPRSDV